MGSYQCKLVLMVDTLAQAYYPMAQTVEDGVDIETRDGGGTSAADIARMRGRPEILELLERRVHDGRG